MVYYACGPFRVENKTLRQRVTIGGVSETVPFVAKIYWNKTSESVIEFHHGGIKLDERSTYNDYYGFMTSVEEAKSQAKRFATRFSVTPESSLSIVVRTTVREVPYIRTARCEMSDLNDDKIRHQVEGIPADWLDGDVHLESKILDETTWSTKG